MCLLCEVKIQIIYIYIYIYILKNICLKNILYDMNVTGCATKNQDNIAQREWHFTCNELGIIRPMLIDHPKPSVPNRDHATITRTRQPTRAQTSEGGSTEP